MQRKIREGINRYSESIESIECRLKEVEQKGTPGFLPGTGGGLDFESKGGFSSTIMKADAVRDFFAGKGSSKSVKTQFSPDTLFYKNTILGESGSPQEPDGVIVQAQRIGMVPGAFRSLNFLDFIPRQPVSSNKIDFPRESSWTNDAAEAEEGASKPESDLEFELIEQPVRTLAHWIKASKQALDDSPWLQSYMIERMLHGARKKLQSQIINGDGTSPNLSGITDTGNHTAFTPTTGDNALDSLNRAKYAVINADYSPNFILMNPADVGAIERLKTSTEEAYLLSNGDARTYVEQGLRGTIWGLPVVATNDLTSGKFILGDREAMLLLMRQDAEFLLSESDDKNVQENKLTLRAEMRAGLATLLP
ncbi:MAG: phage major capsid protein, partial [Gammaproteobacteria bacterium]